MDKKKNEAVDIQPTRPGGPTPCAVCGLYDGEFTAVVGTIRAHAACASARPDVIAKVKARAG